MRVEGDRAVVRVMIEANTGGFAGVLQPIGVAPRHDAAGHTASVAEHALSNVLLQADPEVAKAYQAHGTNVAR